MVIIIVLILLIVVIIDLFDIDDFFDLIIDSFVLVCNFLLLMIKYE